VSVRRAAAVNAARLSGVATRALGRGGGTALPGLVATTLDPGVIADLAAQLVNGVTVVTGTNGKTTTCRILADLLRAAGYRPLRNQSGSNLSRGLASTLIRETGLLGNLAPDDKRIGLFEVDEAALPQVLREVKPARLTLLNLFRDQLDRYGEVATVSSLWKQAIRDLPEVTRLVANADDPLVVDVAMEHGGETVYFGLGSGAKDEEPDYARDVKTCPKCGGEIAYSAIILGHLGHYHCSRCDFRRPEPRVAAISVERHGLDGSNFDLVLEGEIVPVRVPLPGTYNVYNAVAAAATAWSMGVSGATIRDGLARTTPAFGRMERVMVDGREVYLALAKNPAGLNQVVRTLKGLSPSLHVLVLLNDLTADGRDVSWIWDADVEILQGHLESAVFGGTRGFDMALRFKYAGFERAGSEWPVVSSLEDALRVAIAGVPDGHPLFVIPTYTAMLQFRELLTREGHTQPYWDQ
jgi:UDP-N-acetylmuramyl tripeptide synthase